MEEKYIRFKLCFKLGIAVNMNLTVTCTNLPPHLCFLSAELVNSLPQISGKTSWFLLIASDLLLRQSSGDREWNRRAVGSTEHHWLAWLFFWDECTVWILCVNHGLPWSMESLKTSKQTRLRMCLSVILLNLAALKYLLLLFCYFLYFLYGFFCCHILTLFLSIYQSKQILSCYGATLLCM